MWPVGGRGGGLRALHRSEVETVQQHLEGSSHPDHRLVHQQAAAESQNGWRAGMEARWFGSSFGHGLPPQLMSAGGGGWRRRIAADSWAPRALYPGGPLMTRRSEETAHGRWLYTGLAGLPYSSSSSESWRTSISRSAIFFRPSLIEYDGLLGTWR